MFRLHVFRLAAGLAVSFLLASPAMAERCATSVSVRTEASNSVNANLARQIAAIRGSLEKRQCTGRERGLFNPCRDLMGRLSTAMAMLRQNSGSVPERRCVPVDDDTASQRRTRRPDRTVALGGRLETMCVRLSDGYFFPTPNSGYGRARDEPLIRAQCAMICATQDVEVFSMSGGERSADDLYSLKTGKPYNTLKNAGAYRIAPKLDRCDMARYVKAASRIDTKNAMHPETARGTGKDRVRVTLAQIDFLQDMDLRLTPISISTESPAKPEPKPRKIRIVGAPFLPSIE